MNDNSKISQELFETIERYLNDTMDISEKIEFEKSLKEDGILQQQVKEAEVLLLGIESASLKEKMNEFHSQLEAESPIRRMTTSGRTNNRTFYAIAASVVILLGVFWIFNPKSANEKLFEQYFLVDPGLPTTMGTNNEFSFYDGMVNYKREEYDQALIKWTQLLPHKEDNDTLNYFIGVTHLAKGDISKAIPFLEKVTLQSESMFLKDSYFYLGLSNLKNIEVAKSYLKKSDHKDADEILKSLEE